MVPVPDEMRDEEVKACLLVAAGVTMETLPPAQIIAHCADRLAGFKVPRYLEYRTGDFPRLTSMKVDKQTLKALKPDLRVGAWDREA